MLSQKKISSKINSAEYFLELLGSVLHHFWVLLEKNVRKVRFFGKKLKKQNIGSNKLILGNF